MREDRSVADVPEPDATVTCHWCGMTAAPPPPTWSISTDGERGVQYLCERCTRDNVRKIEGSLPTEYW